MCYEPSYHHLSKTAQREERARVLAHHTELRENLAAGLPGAQEAYDNHLETHRANARFLSHTFSEGDERAKSILRQRDAELRVTMRKAARQVALEPDPVKREAARARRIAGRAERREARSRVVFSGTLVKTPSRERELVLA